MADVERVRATTDLLAQLDNNYGGGHARPALIHYLGDEVERLSALSDMCRTTRFSGRAGLTAPSR